MCVVRTLVRVTHCALQHIIAHVLQSTRRVSHQIKVECVDNLCLNIGPRRKRLSQVDAAVNIRSIKPRPANAPKASLPSTIYQYFERFPDLLLCKSSLTVLNQTMKLVPLSIHTITRHKQTLHQCCWGSFLLRIAENTRSLKPPFIAKVNKLLVILLRLARKTRNKGGAKNNAMNPLFDLREKLHSVVPGGSVHALENRIGDVLKGNVNVLAYLIDVRDGVNKLLAEVAGVAIQQPDTHNTLNLCNLIQQIGKPPLILLSEVLTPLVCVLCDQVELGDTRRR
mmetsp:Transcript_25391/g.49568  ORF Transcript_25391/g.49568 Transcript_25391/m.49568 type:complete len:282 (+) Transcript_25391:104-949(+)